MQKKSASFLKVEVETKHIRTVLIRNLDITPFGLLAAVLPVERWATVHRGGRVGIKAFVSLLRGVCVHVPIVRGGVSWLGYDRHRG